MSEAVRSQLRAILTKAADLEASRQQAVQDRDWLRVAALEDELRQLWRAHADIERVA